MSATIPPVHRQAAPKPPQEKRTTFHPGDTAHWDTFSGLVPVRVTSVEAWAHLPAHKRVTFEVLRKKGPYEKGETHQAFPTHVVPQGYIRMAADGHPYILPGYTWEPAPAAQA